MFKNVIKSLGLLVLIFSLGSCSSDDTSDISTTTEEDLNPNDSSIENTTFELLIGDGNKEWKISKATLINAQTSSELNITDAANVKDDRFIFSSVVVDNDGLSDENGSVIWKRREAVAWEAESLANIFKDFYAGNATYGLEVSEITNTFRGLDGLLDFTLLNANTITGIIEVDNNVRLSLELTPITVDDISVIPSQLNFTEIGSIVLDGRGRGTIGLSSSREINQLFFSQKDAADIDLCPTLGTHLENIVSFDIETQSFEEHFFCQASSYTTQELEVIDGKIISISSRSSNTYTTDLNENPEIEILEIDGIQGDIFSRHGTATLGNDIFIIGGNISADPDLTGYEAANTIYKLNTLTNSLELLTNTPTTKYFADGEIIDNKLYIFGGNSIWLDGGFEGKNDIYIYDIDADSWETLLLPENVLDTFTAKNNDLIYVGGSSHFNNGYKEFLGVFNTTTNEFFEIPYSLSSELTGTFRQLTILENTLYLLTGNNDTFKLFSASIE